MMRLTDSCHGPDFYWRRECLIFCIYLKDEYSLVPLLAGISVFFLIADPVDVVVLWFQLSMQLANASSLSHHHIKHILFVAANKVLCFFLNYWI